MGSLRSDHAGLRVLQGAVYAAILPGVSRSWSVADVDDDLWVLVQEERTGVAHRDLVLDHGIRFDLLAFDKLWLGPYRRFTVELDVHVLLCWR